MPSSTSSSSPSVQSVPARPVPPGPWLRTVALAALLAVAAVTGLELLARDRGYQPSVKDDEYAWAWQRARATEHSERTVAIVGTSRILLAFSPAAFETALPGWRFVQLAIDGSQPAGVLVDLAEDPEFRGVVIVDTIESGIVPENLVRAAPYVTAYQRRWRAPGAMAERWLATLVQGHLAILSDNGMHVLANGWTAPPYVTTFADRTQYGDFAKADVAKLRRRHIERSLAQIASAPAPTAADASQWLQAALQMDAYVDRIQARGGRVVYVRMPICDERWQADERVTPKAMYWDQLALRTHALAIHFADYPELRDFACPDTSHIDSKDAPRFTRALLELLKARGVFH